MTTFRLPEATARRARTTAMTIWTAEHRTATDRTERPRLLDLFCGAGGAAMGYHRAGFEVIGVDIKAQPRYPFEFVQADALEVLSDLGMWFWPGLNAIHASPPCQLF